MTEKRRANSKEYQKKTARRKNTSKRENTAGRKNSEHNRDINSKKIFRDPVLCAQFFRDNFDIPELKNVQPEDIEDISERYIPYLGTEFDSDSAKKIRILDIGKKKGAKAEKSNKEKSNKGKKNEEKWNKGKLNKEELNKRELNEESGEESDTEFSNPPFFVSLIDHKSFVDYDVSMQLLRYMMCIWTEYRREMETKKEGCTRRKDFRYPVIIPIIYYEGQASWTAARRLSGRIGKGAEGREWIPDFKYEVVRIHDYSNEELLKRRNEMALVMLMNKVQDEKDLEEFIRIPRETLNEIVHDSPGHVVDVLASVVESLCFKIDVSEEERTECVRKVRKREMGYLFENMEHISIRKVRQEVEAERQKIQQEADEERQKMQQEIEADRQKMQQKIEAEHQKMQQKIEAERQKMQQKIETERQKSQELEEKLRLAEETIKKLQKG